MLVFLYFMYTVRELSCRAVKLENRKTKGVSKGISRE